MMIMMITMLLNTVNTEYKYFRLIDLEGRSRGYAVVHFVPCYNFWNLLIYLLCIKPS